MLDMGFIHEVTRILDLMKNRKNLGLFSATISREVMDIAWVYQRDSVEITVRADEQNKPDILQYRLDVNANEKADALYRILTQGEYDRAMVFCNTKGNTERVTKLLQMRGIDALCIHGDIPQVFFAIVPYNSFNSFNSCSKKQESRLSHQPSYILHLTSYIPT